ncbi:hypothetical protein MNBD_PLANCTO03-1594, partial [hydrothermal vent metagenome]
MALIYCGIDEAGYGPMLGPLCVGFSAFRLAQWEPDAGAPDLWQVLEAAVCRKGRDARSRVAVADSKKLKLSNQSKTRHPLTHLERGVLAFGGLVSTEPDAQAKSLQHKGKKAPPPQPSPARRGGGSRSESDAQSEPDAQAKSLPKDPQPQSHPLDTDLALFAALGTHLEPHDWYGGEPVPLPLGGSAARLAIARNTLALACEAAGVEPIALACIAVGETEFNEVIRTGSSKAHLTTRCFGRYLRRVVERWGSSGDEVRIICDRHSGRTSYAPMIEAAVRGLGFEVETLEESSRCSRYAVQKTEPDAQAKSLEPNLQGSIHIQFRPEAEEAHLPVALASMTAKLARELAMGRFNRYWGSRVPGLKPTAGYVQDARR